MRERLEELMELLKLTPTQFASAIGVQRTTLQHIISGRNEPSLKIIMAIHNSFPDVELEWLLYGKGQAIPGLKQQDPVADQDYPLLPGMDAFFPDDGRKSSVYQNVIDKENAPRQRKQRNNKEFTPSSDAQVKCKEKVIKEVVVFFEDGTYQKFLSELKK